MYNLSIYDCSTKCNFIYNFKPVNEDYLYTILDRVLSEIKRYINDESIHVSFLDNHECIIYRYKENVQNGWFWNSSVYDKEILYKIQPIICVDIENCTQDNESQTEDKIDIAFQNKEIQTDNVHKTETINDNIIIDDTPLELISDSSSPLRETFNSLNINWGQLSWNGDFKQELENKLNLENFGLYSVSKHFKQD